jgi:hypothetical protein
MLSISGDFAHLYCILDSHRSLSLLPDLDSQNKFPEPKEKC